MDVAISDGVDVLSLYLGSGAAPFFRDTISIGASSRPCTTSSFLAPPCAASSSPAPPSDRAPPPGQRGALSAMWASACAALAKGLRLRESDLWNPSVCTSSHPAWVSLPDGAGGACEGLHGPDADEAAERGAGVQGPRHHFPLWYNSRMVLSLLSTSNGFRSTELKDYSSDVIRPSKNQGPFQSNISQCDSAALDMNMQDLDSPNFSPPSQVETSQCLNRGLLPFPLTIAGITYDGLCPGYGSVMQPVFYTQPGLPMWSLNLAKQEGAHASLSHQSDREILNSGQGNHPHGQSFGRQLCEADKEQIQNVESLEEKRHVSSITGQTRSGCICNGSSSGCRSVCNGSNGNLAAVCNGNSVDISRSNMEGANGNGHFTHDGIKMVDIQRFIQREAALNKFCLKRKDRCFEKKVRYQSRKRFAE